MIPLRAARVARVFGIDIAVDASWAVIALLVTAVMYAELTASTTDTGAITLAGLAVVGAVAFFACLLAHELSHSLVAMRQGMRVRRIRLFIFGGASEIEQEAATPGDELVMTVAGPVASLALAGGFLVLALALPSSAGAVDRLVELLALINLALGVFNLAPGFPLDGGRVLRALVWRATGDYRKATVIAVNGGRLLAGVLAGVGLLLVVAAGRLEGLWWIAIGWFLFRAAGASLRRLEVEDALRGVPVGSVMGAAPTVSVDASLASFAADHDAVDRGLVAAVVADGRVRGLVDARALRRVSKDRHDEVTVAAVMTPVGPAAIVDADSPAIDAVTRIGGANALVVVREGRMVGVLRMADVAARVRARRLVWRG